MKAGRSRHLALSLLLAGLGAGCSILGPVSTPTYYFSLAPMAEAQRAAAPLDNPGDPTFALGPVTLPAYLDRNSVATRTSPTELAYSQIDYWAAPLAENISNVMLQNLFVLLSTNRILTYPWVNNAKFDYQIAVEILRFESNTSGECQLTARWMILDGRTQKTVLIRESHFTRAASAANTAAEVAALSATLGDLSEEIATTLRGLRKPT